jgi:hypothetical protein
MAAAIVSGAELPDIIASIPNCCPFSPGQRDTTGIDRTVSVTVIGGTLSVRQTTAEYDATMNHYDRGQQ